MRELTTGIACKHCFSFRQANEEILRVKGGVSGRRLGISRTQPPDPFVSAVSQQNPRFQSVGEITLENLMQHPLPQHRVLDRDEHFDPLVEVARHPVGAAQVDLFVAAVREIKDAAVLEESPDDAAHANTVADSANAWPERADAADQQFDINARLRCLVQGYDHLACRAGRSSWR